MPRKCLLEWFCCFLCTWTGTSTLYSYFSQWALYTSLQGTCRTWLQGLLCTDTQGHPLSWGCLRRIPWRISSSCSLCHTCSRRQCTYSVSCCALSRTCKGRREQGGSAATLYQIVVMGTTLKKMVCGGRCLVVRPAQSVRGQSSMRKKILRRGAATQVASYFLVLLVLTISERS